LKRKNECADVGLKYHSDQYIKGLIYFATCCPRIYRPWARDTLFIRDEETHSKGEEIIQPFFVIFVINTPEYNRPETVLHKDKL